MKKADIIREIKRLAEANGGAPLGMQRFASETGISRSHWRGRYWVNWSDALREAGYAPNQPSLRMTPGYFLKNTPNSPGN